MAAISNRSNPIKYAATPPMTEKRVQVNAMRHQLDGFASTMGIIITSGGIGKNELSIKAINAKNLLAC